MEEMVQCYKKEFWDEITLTESNKELLVLFAQDIFNAFGFQNKHLVKIVNNFFLINFLGVPFPIGECIITCIKKNSSYDYIQLEEFISLIEVFFIKDQCAKEDFFFHLLDFNKDWQIQLDDLMLFFKHLTFGIDVCHEKYKLVINDFFNNKSMMSYTDFKSKTNQDSRMVFMFYSILFNMKTFNEDVLLYYNNNILSLKKEGAIIRWNTKPSLFPKDSNEMMHFKLLSNPLNDLNYFDGFNTGLLRNDINNFNSIDTTISNNDHEVNDNNDNDIDLLNAFEDDKVASFELLKLSSEFPKLFTDKPNNYSTSDNNNISLNKPLLCINNLKANEESNQSKSEITLKHKPYPYKRTTNSNNYKLKTQSAQLSFPKCFLLKQNSLNEDKPSSKYIEFNNVKNSAKANINLVIVHNYLFIINNEFSLNYRIFLLKHSLLFTNLDNSIMLYPSKEKEYKFFFQSKLQMQQFITAFNDSNKENSTEQNYEIIEEIARSKYCKISLIRAKRDPKKNYCLKTLYNSNLFSKLFKWEAYIAKYLSMKQNDHIIQYYDVYESPKKIDILMEYFSIKTLSSVIDKLTNEQCISVLKQLTEAVYFLHLNGIIHRDLKLENILFNTDTSKIKVIDFGLSKVLFPSESTKEFCGTLTYIAPEMIKGEEYNKEIDIWNIGIIAYILEYKRCPFAFYQMNINQIYDEICAFLLAISSKSHSYWEENSIRKIIKLTLTMKVNERPSSAELIQLLE